MRVDVIMANHAGSNKTFDLVLQNKTACNDASRMKTTALNITKLLHNTKLNMLYPTLASVLL